MKKHPSLFFSLILTIAAALSLASCQRAEFDIQEPQAADRQKELREVIITASIADPSSETRTSYNETESKNYWTPGDKIKIFSAGESSEFTSLNTVPETMVKFRGLISFITGTSNDDEDSKDYVWGLYPYSTGATYAEPDGISRTARITTTYTDIQTGVAGTFGDNLAVMIGRSESLSIPFRGAYSGAFFKVNRNDIVSMSLEGLNGEVLAGKATIGLDNSQLPVVYDVADPKTAVTVTAPNGTFEPGANYYIITLPDVALPNGYKVTLRRADGYQGTYELRANRPLNRIKFRNLSDPIDARIENAQNISNGVSTGWVRSTTQGVNEIWYTTSDNEAVTYTVDSETGNEIDDENSVSPVGNNGIGIIRFRAPVTEIDQYAFNNQDLTSVTLPESVETIKEYAFRGCYGLTEINFGSNLKTIKQMAFNDLPGLEEITLPEGLITLDSYAFHTCANLRKVTLPQSLQNPGKELNGLHLPPFYLCRKLVQFVGKFASDDGRCLIKEEADGNRILLNVALGGLENMSYTIPDDVTIIGYYSMSNALMNTIIIPEGVQVIEPSAFTWATGIESVTIPASLTSIGSYAFRRCTHLKEVKLLPTAIPTIVPSDGTYGKMFNYTSSDLKIYVPGELLNAYKTTDYWDEYEDRYVAAQTNNELWYTVREGTSDQDAINVTVWPDWDEAYGTQISPYYDEGRGVWVAEFDNPITYIPERAFRNNPYIESIILPGSVSEIGNQAFEFCSSLKIVQFGNDFMESIGDEAFGSCDLRTVSIPSTNWLGQHSFSYNNNLTTVTLGSYIDFSADDGNPFMSCGSLTQFLGENDMISDDGKCLIYNNKLISYASASTTGSYTIPTNVTVIGAQALLGAQFQDVILPEGLTSIGWAALASCPNLQKLDIPLSVTTLAGRFLSNSPSVEYVKMNAYNPPDASNVSFADIPEGLSVMIPGAGASRYTYNTGSNPWYDIRSHLVVYQTDYELWLHRVDNSYDGMYFVGDFDGDGEYDATIQSPFNISPGGVTMGVQPAVDIPDNLKTGYITVVYRESMDPITKMPDYGLSDEYPGVINTGEPTGPKYNWASLPNTVTEIGQMAFDGCSNLSLMPVNVNSLVTIGDYAFYGCSSMKLGNVDSSTMMSFDNLTYIGTNAFKGCTSLNRPITGTNVATIGDSAFEGSSLPGFSFPSVSDLGKSAFRSCTNLGSYQSGCRLDGQLTEIKDSTFAASGLKKLNISDNTPVAKVGNSAFYQCRNLNTIGSTTGVAQMGNVTEITYQSFAQTGITVLKLPNLKKISGTLAFYSSPITQLELPKLESAFSNAFLYMNSLQELYLPSIKSMGTNMFTSGKLTKLHLGPDISNLTNLLWSGNPGSQFSVEIYLDRTTPASVSTTTFSSNMLNIAAIYVPAGSVSAYKASTAWQNALAVAGATVDVIQAMP